MAQSRRKFIKNISLATIATTGIVTFLKKYTKAFGPYNFQEHINDIVHHAFRLTDHNSLLNLEYYFINCSYDSFQNRVWAKYGPHENYMVVRLPQQHIAEQSFLEKDQQGNTITNFKAATYISGYSYLVFRILFTDERFFRNYKIYGEGEYTYIDLTKEELLKWDNENKFRLVVRQDLTESLFELASVPYYNTPKPDSVNKREKILDSLIQINHDKDSIKGLSREKDSIENNYKKPFLENHYPFQNDLKKDSIKLNDSLKIEIDRGIYNPNKFPKTYGDPVTAIELPWRLIISPKLPDSSRFKFKWAIPETNLEKLNPKDPKEKNKHKLWTATLSIAERDDQEYIDRKKAEKNNNKENPSASTGSLNDVINQLELMILGSPDYPEIKFKGDIILPTGAHRHDLVALYIKLKVLARTEKLTLSAVGATTKIHLKNEKIEDALKQGIGVIEWNQIISLGRDEKVEVSTLFLEAEFGHKMAFIIIAERELKSGIYPLIKKAFIMPLDITKDYSNHITQDIVKIDSDGKTLDNKPKEIVSRFNAPFKKITFSETKPKLFIPVAGKTEFNQNELNQTETSFEFEAIDWHDNIIKFSKKINALPFGAVVQKDEKGNLLIQSEKGNIAKIIAPKDSSMYLPHTDSLPQLKDTIPFYSRVSLDSILIKTDSTSKKTYTIDSSLKVQDSLHKSFPKLISQSFSTIQENAQLDSLQDWLEKFIRIYKGIPDKKPITASYIVEKLSDKYLLDNNVYKDLFDKGFTKISNYLDTKPITDFITFIYSFDAPQEPYKSLINQIENIPAGNSNLKEFLDNLRQNKEVEKSFSEFRKNIEFQKFVNDKWPLFFKNIYKDFPRLVAFIKNYSNFGLYEFIRINSPELANFIISLNQILTTQSKAFDDLVLNIQNRIQIIYAIEEKAKTISGLILLQKQKIGYAIKEKYDDVEKTLGATRQQLINNLTKETGQVKKSLSELESEYIIFKGGLRETENGMFDFFHDYAIIPQVAQAKVYVSALNKLVNEDLPISINYARDYLENQVRDTEFEIKQNAAMVFAEVQQYSREQVKGFIQNIGEKMPGLNVEIPAHYLTYARNPKELEDKALQTVTSQLGIPGDFTTTLKNYSRDLIFISEDVKKAVKVMDDLRNADPKKYFKDLGAKLFGSIGLEDILDVGFDLPRITELPDKIIYQVSTDKFKNFRAAFVQFTPHINNTTRLELFISKNIKNIQEYYAYTQLNNFSVGVIIGGTEVLTVMFDQFKITSAPNQPKKTDVSITDVKLGGPLEFIADLAKKFMAPGNGMRIKPGPRSLSVDYTIALPSISAPAFNFRNLQMVIGVNIPYDPSTLKAISFTFGVNKPEDKFLVSAGTYGGRGHFMLRATPKGIEQIDIAIELGAYASIDLGIGRGEVFLFFGFWFVCGKDDGGQNLIKAVAYIICSGSATVLGFISIGVSVLIALTYIKRGQAALFYGEAVVTYSVKIAFFKKEFSIRYYKEIAGSSNGNNTQSLQAGAILLDTGASGGIYATDNNEAAGFTDVFKDEDMLKEYLSCFE
ncbi:hypothetical protein [Segetibacter koreensis]|uniref:hypothetical protein n=1 Tax=Segetibacter koreensis TaxID=398037 RepID=UPI00036BC56B|nr:hypothetical protein [Segetibacter koreensis]